MSVLDESDLDDEQKPLVLEWAKRLHLIYNVDLLTLKFELLEEETKERWIRAALAVVMDEIVVSRESYNVGYTMATLDIAEVEHNS